MEDFGHAYNFPFGGNSRFNREARDCTMHLNKERLEWVRKVLAEKAEDDGPVWGPEIDIDRKPDWLKDTDVCAINQGFVWLGESAAFNAAGWYWSKGITQIKLLADHAYYAVQAYNKEHGTSYTYWGGQGDKPADWDGVRVVLRNGKTIPSPISWSHPWGEGAEEEFDVIGYTRKADDLKDFLTEWLECATSVREGPSWFSRGVGLCQCAEMWDVSKGRNARRMLKEKMRAEFPEKSSFPFGGSVRYVEDKTDKSAHQNPERLAWVRKTLGIVEGAVAKPDSSLVLDREAMGRILKASYDLIPFDQLIDSALAQYKKEIGRD